MDTSEKSARAGDIRPKAPRRSFAEALKDAGFLFATPFISMAYMAMFPFIAAWFVWQAWRARKAAS